MFFPEMANESCVLNAEEGPKIPGDSLWSPSFYPSAVEHPELPPRTQQYS